MSAPVLPLADKVIWVTGAGKSLASVRSEYLEAKVFNTILATNTVGTYLCARAAAQIMLDQRGEDILRRIPMPRTGAPQELAGAASCPLSDASSYVTGSTLVVDGGWQAW